MINENSPVGKAATAGDIVAGGIVATTGIAVASQHQSDPDTTNKSAAEPIQLKMPSLLNEYHPVEDAERANAENHGSNKPLLSSQYGDNPFKLGKRNRTIAGIWLHVKHIEDESLLEELKAKNQHPTHVCLLCWELIRLTFDKKKECFLTTEGLKHFRDTHPGHPLVLKSEGKQKLKGDQIFGGMLLAGSMNGSKIEGLSTNGGSVSRRLDSFYVPPSIVARSKAARFYVYGKTHISKATFDDPEFRLVIFILQWFQ